MFYISVKQFINNEWMHLGEVVKLKSRKSANSTLAIIQDNMANIVNDNITLCLEHDGSTLLILNTRLGPIKLIVSYRIDTNS